MPIRLECPNPACKVKLTVKDHLAGKRVPCPKCKQPVTIPALVDVEALAAAALDDDAATKQAAKGSTIDFTCPFCDEELHLPRDLGGKQTSCPNPECRRIVKVPLPKDDKRDDWRTVTRTGPTGARENVEAAPLEGAWDTSRATVSGEALVEAGAVPEKVEPVTAAQWVRRGVAATTAVLVLVVAAVWVRSYWSSSQMQSLLAQGLSYAGDGSKLKPEWKAELERLGGEYHLDAGQQSKAVEHFTKARALLLGSPAGGERDAAMRDLALTQARVTQGEVSKELSRTLLGKDFGEEARLIAWREVMGQLLAGGRGKEAYELDLQLVGDTQPATVPAEGEAKIDDEGGPGEGEVKNEPPPAKKEKPAPAAPSLLLSQRIALALAMKQDGRAEQVKPWPKDKAEPDLIARLGYAEGLARQDKYAAAEGLARLPGPVLDRLQTWLALADVAWSAGKGDEARRYAQEAQSLFEKDLKKTKISPWHVWQLSRAVARAGGSEAKALADSIADAPLKGRAQLEIFLLQLAGKGRVEPGKIDDTVHDKATLAYGLALEAVSRQNARVGTGGDEQRANELPEELRPFVFLGAALGAQDGKR